MRLMSKLLVLICFSLLTACSQAPDSVVDDHDDTQIQEIAVPGHKSPSFVLFGKPTATICGFREHNAQELAAVRDQAKPYRDGYSYVDTYSDGSGDHRLYFSESRARSPKDTVLIFCSGKSSQLGASCGLLGISPAGCFETSVGAYTLIELEQLTANINRSYPKW